MSQLLMMIFWAIFDLIIILFSTAKSIHLIYITWSNVCSCILMIMIFTADIATQCFLQFNTLKPKIWCNCWLGIIPSTDLLRPIWNIIATSIWSCYICDIKDAFSRLRPIFDINVILSENWSSPIWGIIVGELMLIDQFCKWVNLVLELFDLIILLWYLLFLRTDGFGHVS